MLQKHIFTRSVVCINLSQQVRFNFFIFLFCFSSRKGGVFRQGLFHRLKQYKFETIFNFTHNHRRGVQAFFLGCEIIGCRPLLDRMAKQWTLLLGSRMRIQFLNSEKKRLKNHLNLNFGWVLQINDYLFAYKRRL